MLSTLERNREVNTEKYGATVVVIDAGVQDYQLLVAGIEPTAEVIVLDSQQDGITQITTAISEKKTTSLQLIAHGSPGSLRLGNTVLSLDNLHTYQQQLQQWQVTDILIYGCEVAAGEQGKTFLKQLHQLTDANIAAASEKVGNSQLGGSWELDVKIGRISTELAINAVVRAAYPQVLVDFTSTNFPTGDFPSSVAVGDFDNDGILDLAVANRDSNDVSILIKQDDGNFSAPTNFNVGNAPLSVAVGDFDNDENLDLAVANSASNTVSILLGQGNGTFVTGDTLNVGDEPYSVAVGDFDNDENLDLAVVNANSGNVSVILRQSDGSFSLPKDFQVGVRPFSLALGDFDKDNILDLAVANNADDNVSVLLGKGDGEFDTAKYFNVGNSPFSVVVGDFNQDNILDLATANLLSNDVSVLLGEIGGNFGAAKNFSVDDGPNSLAVGDFNQDGILDLAVANRLSQNLSLLLGEVDDNFATPINFNNVGLSPTSVVVGKFNQDDLLDIAVANRGDNNITILLNNPPPPTPTALIRTNDVFNISSANTTARLVVSLASQSSLLVNELIAFTVDDESGTVNGIAPGAAGYTEAAITRSSVIFSALSSSDIPSGFDTSNITRTLDFSANTNLRFALVKGTTVDAVKAGAVKTRDVNSSEVIFSSSSDVIFSSSSSLSVGELGNNVFSLGWQDGSGSTEFNNLVVNVQAADSSLPTGTDLQSQTEREVIDLRSFTGSVAATFTVYREALFDNYVGFYKVTDENGGIDTNNDGVADVSPGQTGYIQAVVNQRLSGIDLTVNDQSTANYSGTLEGGAIYVPFIIVNGRPDALLDTDTSNNPAVYFPFLGLNSDGADHVRLLGDNIFGFEDLPSLGDADFNDVIVKIDLGIA